jgi:hypothetical protein
MASRSLIVLVAALLLVLAIVVFFVTLGDYLFQPSHRRRSHPTREAALKDACSQLLQGYAVNRIVGPNKTITAERVRDWCAKHRP